MTEQTQRARFAGAVVGGLIGIVPAPIGLLEPELDILVPAGAVGAAAGALLGARYGPRVRNGSGAAAAMLGAKMAVLAVLVGDLLVCSAIALTATGSGAEGFLFALVLLPIIGLAVVGLPALGMALAGGLAWVAVMRLLPGRWIGEAGDR